MDLERQNFETVASQASNAVYELNSGVRRLQRLCSRPTASSNLSSVVSKVSQNCADSSKVIESLNNWKAQDLTTTQSQQQAQISQEFSALAREITSLQSKAASLLREQIDAASAAAAANERDTSHEPTEETPLIQVLDELDQGAVDLHTSLLEERELEISEIQRGMNEINAIFTDLGTLIQEQGAQLDTVEDNVTNMASNTESAQRELTRANNYQKSRGKWSCYFLLFLLVITILVGISKV